MTDVLIIREKDTQRHRKGGEAGEEGAMLPQAKKCQESPGAGRGKEGLFPGAFHSNGLDNTLISDFWPPD